MQYSNGYAVAVTLHGSVVESSADGVVALPFGEDYTVRLINRNRRRAVAVVYVDGQNVTGRGIVVSGNSSVDLERPTDKAVRFRFASTESEAAAEHGKAGADVDGTKGLVKVEWRPEREIQPYGTGFLGATSTRETSRYEPAGPGGSSLRKSRLRNSPPVSDKSLSANRGLTTEDCTVAGQSLGHMELERCTSFAPTSGGIKLPDLKTGVTVEGARSSQEFQYVSFDLDHSAPVTMTMLKLKGYVASEGIPATGTRYCPACRTKTMKKTDKFCRNCGEQL
jgi:hypothetical protein